MNPIIEVVKPAARFSRSMYRTATSPIRLLPDFIIIGTERGGTTSLYNYLIEHQNIISALRKKDVRFFDYQFQKGVSWYRAQFPSSLHKFYAEYVHKQNFITGEASANYLFHPHAPKRVAETLPRVKLIVLLRNPVERAYSHYCLKVGQGRERLSFEEAIAKEEERTQEEREKEAADENYVSYKFWYYNYTYLARGIYVDQLQRWYRFFPKDQLLILKSEDMYADTAAVYKQTLAFLNISAVEDTNYQSKEFKQYNPPKYTTAGVIDPELKRLLPESVKSEYDHYTPPEKIPPRKMDLDTRSRLVAYYEPDNARLYELLGRDFGWT